MAETMSSVLRDHIEVVRVDPRALTPKVAWRMGISHEELLKRYGRAQRNNEEYITHIFRLSKLN